MKKRIKNIFVDMVALFMLSTFLCAQAGNPGQDAMHCLEVSMEQSSNSTRIYFNNICDYKIFVVWCGDVKYSNRKCGSLEQYFTHSTNIKPHQTEGAVIEINGDIKYAACVGGIGFGSKGIYHPSIEKGKYACTET